MVQPTNRSPDSGNSKTFSMQAKAKLKPIHKSASFAVHRRSSPFIAIHRHSSPCIALHRRSSPFIALHRRSSPCIQLGFLLAKKSQPSPRSDIRFAHRAEVTGNGKESRLVIFPST
ncbi:hypothetical protein [Paenibacillus sp. D9]|uniref:hypothetical protein n=1 Tax=Paenibacillus sp. D9 TaxID=665792 RepID=UPI0012EE25C8|nr:hypothetical protein [Paenibacillus sp. D9]